MTSDIITYLEHVGELASEEPNTLTSKEGEVLGRGTVPFHFARVRGQWRHGKSK